MKILLTMTSLHSRHCEDDRTKQSSQNRLPRLPSGSLAMTIYFWILRSFHSL
ncbi:hypothetical protein [Helicobacter fennelliae]|uniref:hypothetical protein n=1 Tax=Helicobacter fennelliae TaxID=215 RepID=UPI0015F29042|nr:hypothetical protein [Helicobacter fennelliae]